MLMCTGCFTSAVLGLLDVLGGGNLAGFGTRKKRLQKGSFLLQCHVLVTTPTCSRRISGCQPKTIVGGNDSAHRRDRYPGVSGYLFGFAGSNQRIIDNPPTLAYPKAWIQFHATFDFFKRKMSCGSGDSASQYSCSLLYFMFLLIIPAGTRVSIRPPTGHHYHLADSCWRTCADLARTLLLPSLPPTPPAGRTTNTAPQPYASALALVGHRPSHEDSSRPPSRSSHAEHGTPAHPLPATDPGTWLHPPFHQ